MQADTLGNATLVDAETVDEVARLGFHRDFVANSVKDRLQNKVCLPSYTLTPGRPARNFKQKVSSRHGSVKVCCGSRP